MVFGSWATVAVDGSQQALTGALIAYEIAVTDSEVTLSSGDDPYGPRSFGIVAARAVESWVEYELRGQGGTYYLTAQLGTRRDGKRAAVFVLSHPGLQAKTERFVIPEPDGTIAVGVPPPVDVPPVSTPVGTRARRVDQAGQESNGLRRVTPMDVMGHSDRKVAPNYPSAARAGSVEGTVVVEVTIDEKGKVVEATALTGPAVLRAEAVRAAHQWRFRPFVFEGVASRVRGEITFRFTR
jgi:TonB family protein